MGVYGSVWVLFDQTCYIWPKLYVLCWIGFIYFLAKPEPNQHDWERVGLDQVNQVKLIKIFYLFYKRIQLRVHCYSRFHVKNQIFPFFLKKKLANTELVLNLGHYLNGSMNATLHYYSILPWRSGNEEKKGVSGVGLSNGRGGLWGGDLGEGVEVVGSWRGGTDRVTICSSVVIDRGWYNEEEPFCNHHALFVAPNRHHHAPFATLLRVVVEGPRGEKG